MIRRDSLASSRKIKRNRLIKKVSFYFLLSIVFFVIFVAFFYIPKFKIKEIEVSGVSESNRNKLSSEFSEIMKAKYFGLLPYNNIFVFPDESLRAEILISYPSIKDIEFKIFPPEKVLTIASERELFAVWCFKEGECSFVDEGGFVFKLSPIFYGDLFLKFFDERKDSSFYDFSKGGQVLSRDNFKMITEFISLASSTDIVIYRIFIKDDGLYEMETSLGWRIILNNNNNAEDSFQNLKIMLDNQIKEDYMEKIGYIDLRFGNKIFYKFNDE